MLSKWPEARLECPSCLAYMILDGSRMTDEGWKVSYHAVYPLAWLVFPCNSTKLQHEALASSAHPQFQYLSQNVERRSHLSTMQYTPIIFSSACF